MTPLMRQLQQTFPELSFMQEELFLSNGTFIENIKKLGPNFYRKAIPWHMVLTLEYSFLGQQIRSNLLSRENGNREKVKRQLITALMLAEFLEHIYQNYLIVPREVARLSQQQKLYREILMELGGTLPAYKPSKVEVGLSVSQRVRTLTAEINMYRLLFTRSKRVLDLIDALNTGSETYRHFVKNIDKHLDPLLPHVAWIFYLPRLITNLFLLVKHTIPGPWMGEEEKSLGWFVRFGAQMQRRWFELGNDIAWVWLGCMNCFLLTGVLAATGAYLSVACFAFDVIMAVTRAYIELNRLYELKKRYTLMSSQSTDPEERKEAKEHIDVINSRINFELLRLGTHIMTTSVLFFAMCCTIPAFSFPPALLLVSAICILVVSSINIALVPILNNKRAKDMIEAPSGVAKLGFFAKQDEAVLEELQEQRSCFSFC